MTKVEEYKAKLKEAIEARKEQLVEAKFNNERLLNLQVKQAIATENLAKLQALKEAAEDLHPVKTKTGLKEIKIQKQYGLGEECGEILGLLQATRYATEEHKQELLAMTNLDMVTIENTLDALGTTAYYNRNYGVVVESTPYNVDKLRVYLELVAEMLELVDVDLSQINEKNFTKRFALAELRAEEDKANDEKYKALASQQIAV